MPTTDLRTCLRMAKQRRRDTTVEINLRRVLHSRGLRYRVDAAIPGLTRRRSDLTFASSRVVVFVDGCFWHGCPEHKTAPQTNAAWWAAKLARNVERDREPTPISSNVGGPWSGSGSMRTQSARQISSRLLFDRVIRVITVSVGLLWYPCSGASRLSTCGRVEGTG